MIVEEVRQTVEAAIEAAKADGWRIVRQLVISHSSKACCAAGATLISSFVCNPAKPYLGGYKSAFALLSGMSLSEATCFIVAFDGGNILGQLGPGEKAAFDLGREIAAKYVDTPEVETT